MEDETVISTETRRVQLFSFHLASSRLEYKLHFCVKSNILV